jgi:hypothetical protein
VCENLERERVSLCNSEVIEAVFSRSDKCLDNNQGSEGGNSDPTPITGMGCVQPLSFSSSESSSKNNSSPPSVTLVFNTS